MWDFVYKSNAEQIQERLSFGRGSEHKELKISHLQLETTRGAFTKFIVALVFILPIFRF